MKTNRFKLLFLFNIINLCKRICLLTHFEANIISFFKLSLIFPDKNVLKLYKRTSTFYDHAKALLQNKKKIEQNNFMLTKKKFKKGKRITKHSQKVITISPLCNRKANLSNCLPEN